MFKEIKDYLKPPFNDLSKFSNEELTEMNNEFHNLIPELMNYEYYNVPVIDKLNIHKQIVEIHRNIEAIRQEFVHRSNKI